MAPTKIRSEAPTDGEEWFLGINARKDRWREDSESESLRSLPVLQPMTGLCFLRHREKSPNDQAKRQYALLYILKTSLGRCTEKELQWGQGTGPLGEERGRWGGGLRKTGETF